MAAKMHLLHMPNECLRKIFSFLSFHEIAQSRLVCRKFNNICSDLLKSEFCRLEQLIRDYHRELKLLLPRRESERRKHALAGHADLLTAVETRISLLGMTIMRYVDEGYCAFFPGKVLDELRRVYVAIKTSSGSISRSAETLRELRDISSMAMEYFDETILPHICESKLRQQQQSVNDLAYRRRIRNLHQASLLKNLNEAFPNMANFGFLTPPSPSASSSSSTFNVAPHRLSSCFDSLIPQQAQPRMSLESNSANVEESRGFLNESQDSQVGENSLQQTIASLLANQRAMTERITRLNNMVISLGYRLHKLESGGEPSKSRSMLKRPLSGPDDEDHNGNGDISPAKKQK